MEKLTDKTEQILIERFGKDSLIALATCENNVPYVRTVDAFYHDRAFYVLTYALSNKMKQLAENPSAAISGEWFTAQGNAHNMGWFASAENKPIADKMRSIFSEWIDNGHNDLSDRNTIILRIELTQGVLFSHGTRYDIDFT